MRFPYKVQGKPISFEGKGDFLKFDPEIGGTVRTEAPPPDTSPRVVKLKTFNPEGDENEIFAEHKSGGAPNCPVKILKVTRKRFVEIIDRLSADKKLVRKIILEWRRQHIHYLNGGTESLEDNGPNLEIYHCLGGEKNENDYISIFHFLESEILDQIVSLHAMPEDLKDLEPITREFRVTGSAS